MRLRRKESWKFYCELKMTSSLMYQSETSKIDNCWNKGRLFRQLWTTTYGCLLQKYSYNAQKNYVQMSNKFWIFSLGWLGCERKLFKSSSGNSYFSNICEKSIPHSSVWLYFVFSPQCYLDSPFSAQKRISLITPFVKVKFIGYIYFV